MSDQGFTILLSLAVSNAPIYLYEAKSNQETAAGGGGDLWCHTGSFTGRYQLKGNTHEISNHHMKHPSVGPESLSEILSMATYSCPHIIQLLLKKKLPKYRFL